MRTKLLLSVLLCTAVAGGWYVLSSARTAAAQLPATRGVQSAHASEQAWIVDDIVESIAAWRAGAAPALGAARVTELPGGGPAPRFQVDLAPSSHATLVIDHHIWAPESYAPIVSATLVGSVAPAGGHVASSVAALTNPVAEVIQAENLRISALLQANPRSPDAHENAALVLAAFALREAANDFSDPRRSMSRMTAHLAIAQHLRGEPGIAGRIAHAALLTLVGRQRDALAAIDRLQSLPETGVAAWRRALRLRNTADWRLTRGERSLTLLEQLETLRAIQSSLGSDGALNYLDTLDEVPQSTSWIRLVLHSGFSVEAGNALAAVAPEVEVAEARLVAERFGDAPALSSQAELVAALNVPPARSTIDPASGTVRVIDWGLWASSTQRHLMMELQRLHHHLNQHLGLPKDASATAQQLEAFSGLTLYPLLRRYMATEAAPFEKALQAAAALCREQPELVPFQAWQRLYKKPDFWSGSLAVVPQLASWFTPITPAGTAFEIALRGFDSQKEGVYPRISHPEIARFRALAPFARMIVMANVIGKHGGYPPHTILEQEYGDFAKYDLTLARRVARFAAADPQAYVPLMRQVGELDPSELKTLGAYLADRGRAAEAERVYEEWLAGARDQVEVANNAHWLVRRYYDTGRQAKAEALARRAAEVHSYGGLLTLADFHEWQGDLAQARQLHRTASERYDNSIMLLGFAMRHGVRSGISSDERATVERQLFPDGLMRVEPAALTGDPARGLSLVEVGEYGRRAGLRNNDIVVAVDGLRVQNEKQFRVARAASSSREMALLVWRKGQYLRLDTPLRFDWPLHNRREYIQGKTPIVPIGKPE